MQIKIKAQNISHSYEKTKAVKNASFEVNESEIFGLIGPDGAGKTTLIRILNTLILPKEGKGEIMSYDIVKDYRKIRKIVGYMPGRFSLYEDLSVEENLKFFAGIFGTTIEENYELVAPIYRQIEPFKNRKAGALSGGMKQKLALSCALIHRPEVLFLDEPTTGVDAVSRSEFWEMLKNLKLFGISILVSTPYMDEASLCDRVALIQKGNIMEINTPQKIRDEFSHQLVEINTKNQFQTLKALRNWDKAHSVHAFGQNLHFIAKEQLSISEIEDFLRTKNIDLQKIDIIKPDIEDCFMEKMISTGNNT